MNKLPDCSTERFIIDQEYGTNTKDQLTEGTLTCLQYPVGFDTIIVDRGTGGRSLLERYIHFLFKNPHLWNAILQSVRFTVVLDAALRQGTLTF